MKVLGLMSGTSADGVDAVLADFSGRSARPRWRILASAASPYPSSLRQQLVAAGQGEALAARDWLELAEAVTDAQAAAALACDPAGEAELVGCHGQTVWHRPPEPGRPGASWQLLLGPGLAQRLQRPVIFDFRSADLALGGQGAPLVPATDAALLGGVGGWRALLNLGGIANLTLLPPATGPDRRSAVLGWDCGPANTLLDLAAQRFSAGERSFDAGGAWAARGQVHERLIEQWLQEPYVQQRPPKSTGRELFGGPDLERRLAQLQALAPEAGSSDSLPSEGPTSSSDTSATGPFATDPLATNPLATDRPTRDRLATDRLATPPLATDLFAAGPFAADALATLTAFTAAVVAQDLARGPRPLELLVAGGGARNQTLMAQLRRRCRGMAVRPLAELGIADDQREALAFALLAWWHQRRHRGSLPSVTGAPKASLLGLRAPVPG